MLTSYLEELQKLGDKESPLKQILRGKTPQDAAEAFAGRSAGAEEEGRRRHDPLGPVAGRTGAQVKKEA